MNDRRSRSPLHPLSREARTQEAFALLKDGRHAEARMILEAIVAADDADAAVLETLGDVREKLGDASGAIDAYFSAVTHLRARGELKRSLGVLELMGLVNDRLAAVPREAAEVRRALGDVEGCWRDVMAAATLALAERDLETVELVCAEHADVLPGAGPALEVVRRVEQQQPRAAVDLACMMARELVQRRRFDDALALFACALDADPKDRQALHGRAGALLETGRAAEAHVVVERALALEPDDLVGLCLLERAALALGDAHGASAARVRIEDAARGREVVVREPQPPAGEDAAAETGRYVFTNDDTDADTDEESTDREP